MNTTTKIVVAALIVGAAIGLVLGHSFWPTTQFQSVAGSSPAGSDFSTSKEYSTVMNLSSSTGTTTSILNTDTNARYVTSVFADCQGVGTVSSSVAALTFTMATSTQSYAGSTTVLSVSPATGYVTLATSSTVSTVASSTWQTPYPQLWAPATYLNIFTNATNTAVCTVGVHTVAS
jgi:hypothetical protein